MEIVEKIARLLCWKNGSDPDTSLGGDKQNFLWMEYSDTAEAVLESVIEEFAVTFSVKATETFDRKISWLVHIEDKKNE